MGWCNSYGLREGYEVQFRLRWTSSKIEHFFVCIEDSQNFPGANRPLAMSFAAKKGWEPWLQRFRHTQLTWSSNCSVGTWENDRPKSFWTCQKPWRSEQKPWSIRTWVAFLMPAKRGAMIESLQLPKYLAFTAFQCKQAWNLPLTISNRYNILREWFDSFKPT